MGIRDMAEDSSMSMKSQDLLVGIVMSRFNRDIGEAILSSCNKALLQLGVPAEHCSLETVPGALEIPLMLDAMARSGRFDALIAIGSVIRGETYHFELVCNESARGIGEVALTYGIPVANAVLTTNDRQQAQARSSEKGHDAAYVAIEMALRLKPYQELKD
ncbi:MAG: 6,7-dimethyl-8-ribityllumazine synthase [Proteobacteria bacterium]|nr:6,7-dimethyl-8-ribityllumazine synthase [Pseudomonadota bacterium]MDE3207432.1 6,7-dimethyl-8-ribityllumazine synthase [Pseudomonadota bacterium]